MRMWKFFKKPDRDGEIPETVTLQDMYQLYALTNQKELADEFREMHDMSKFIEKTEKDIDEDEYRLYANKNRSRVLSKTKFTTQGESGPTSIYLTVTDLEENIVTEHYIKSFSDEMFWYNIPINPNYFGRKYINALMFIYFIDYYDLINMNIEREDIPSPDPWVDELSVYISLFKDILNN